MTQPMDIPLEKVQWELGARLLRELTLLAEVERLRVEVERLQVELEREQHLRRSHNVSGWAEAN